MGEPVNLTVRMSDQNIDRIAREVARVVLVDVRGAPGSRLAGAGDVRHRALRRAVDSIPLAITRLGTGAGWAGMRDHRGVKIAVPPADRC